MYPHPMRVCGLTGEATPKQIEYAEQIEKLLNVVIPEERTKQKYSDFINKRRKGGAFCERCFYVPIRCFNRCYDFYGVYLLHCIWQVQS